MYIGRRPCFVFSSCVFFGTIFWSATTHDWNGFVASRVLMAFMGSSTEGLAAAVIPDLFFLHERGYWMGVLTLFWCAGAALGAIVSGFVITALGWRWNFWVCHPLFVWSSMAKLVTLAKCHCRRR